MQKKKENHIFQNMKRKREKERERKKEREVEGRGLKKSEGSGKI